MTNYQNGAHTTGTNNGRSWSRARKILCMRVDNIGDVLMTTPAIRALKESFGAEITLLASNAGAEVASFVPEIDRVILFDAPWVNTYEGLADSDDTLRMVERLRGEAFDAVVIFTVYSQNPLPAAMLAFLADIPLRLAHSHENPYTLLTDWVPDPEPQKFVRHEVRRQLDLVAHVGAHCENERLSLRPDDQVQTRLRHALAAQNVDLMQPWLILHPGVSEERRRYNADAYITVGRTLHRQLGCPILVTGVAQEKEIVCAVADGIGPAAHALPGALSLEEFINLIAMAPLLITNNTGPVHIAAALGTPVVDVYADTNPQHTPWRVAHRVLYFDVACKACARNICAADHSGPRREVQPQEVVRAALDLWTETQALGSRLWAGAAHISDPSFIDVQTIGGLYLPNAAGDAVHFAQRGLPPKNVHAGKVQNEPHAPTDPARHS